MVSGIKEVLFIYSMAMVRMTACFTVMPLLNAKSLGSAMIRNGVVGGLAIFLYPMIEAQQPEILPEMGALLLLLAKEAFIGILIGFIATIPFWAMESAGFFIDNQRGASMANSTNAMTGSESSPTGIMFAQAFLGIYLTSGMLLVLLEAVFKSYETWPLFSFYPVLKSQAMLFFMHQFDLIIITAVWFAAPAIIAMFLAEFGVALISRSAPSLNVFILAMPIKSGVALSVLVVYFATIMELSKKFSLQLPEFITQLGRLLI